MGQKWGIRHFQNPDGTLTAEGKRRYGDISVKSKEYANKLDTYAKYKDMKKNRKALGLSKSDVKNAKKEYKKANREYLDKNWEVENELDDRISPMDRALIDLEGWDDAVDYVTNHNITYEQAIARVKEETYERKAAKLINAVQKKVDDYLDSDDDLDW